MRTPVILASALLAVAATASPAVAAKPEPVPTPPTETIGHLCGGITITVTKNTAKVTSEADASGFTEHVRGNFVQQVTSLRTGRSVVVRTPGRVHVVGTRERVTISNSGRTFLLAFGELQAEAHRGAGLPDVAVVSGRVVIERTLDPVTGAPVDDDITYTGHVTDVCELLE